MRREIAAWSTNGVRTNVLFACWRRTAAKDDWPQLLGGWLVAEPSPAEAKLLVARRVAESFLMGETGLDHQQVELLARSLHRDVQELMFESWPAAEDGLILRENMRRLIENSGADSKGGLAKTLGVSAATLSRWISGQQVPDTRARRAIVSLFGLRSSEDLEQTPLFLSYTPVTHAERLVWIQSRLVRMSWTELGELFPAFQRLCSKPV